MEYSVVSEWPMAIEEAGVLRETEEGPKQSRITRSKGRGRGRTGRPRKQTSAWDNHATLQALETLARLLTPQIMLPVQLKSEPEDLPEFGLLRAVLLSAVVDYVDSFKPSPMRKLHSAGAKPGASPRVGLRETQGHQLNSICAARCMGLAPTRCGPRSGS